MTDYAIGDIQGCLEPVLRLLAEVQFNPARDNLWVAGDLVNRGPDSIGVIQYLRQIDDCCRIVLGNHDLHMLAVYYGYKKPGAKDTLVQVTQSPEAKGLIDFVRNQPMMHHDKTLGYAMTHAGIPSIWRTRKARELAEEVSEVLRTERLLRMFLANMYGNTPDVWKDSLEGTSRWRVITNYLTRMRFTDDKGRLDLEHKEGPDHPPKGMKPWFKYPARKKRSIRLIFGHWAALNGLFTDKDVLGLDTGYVWGGTMSMVNLQQQELLQIDPNGVISSRNIRLASPPSQEEAALGPTL
ncbi:symmetrical bis(5'-nucleosyl)-tetraphosphatase [Gynuella sp.]|uniref:symmetrical bis(5'-nucleosyl)-tetraphosphatase n=1 Tax=Gynuella sp. TaxID=2969146 RepID=UPI003D0A44E0